MPGCTRTLALTLFVSASICISFASIAGAQNPPPPTAAQNNSTAVLREVKSDGLKTFTNDQVTTLGGLQIGPQGRNDDLQRAPDKLVPSRVFARLKYTCCSRADGLVLLFHLKEA